MFASVPVLFIIMNAMSSFILKRFRPLNLLRDFKAWKFLVSKVSKVQQLALAFGHAS